MEVDLHKYDLTPAQKKQSKKNVLLDAFATSTTNEEPELIYITAGPGAGKSSAERYFEDKLSSLKGIIPFIFNSDKLATYHPKSRIALKKLLPQKYYKVTRKFVRPAAPIIFEKLRGEKISIINENTLDHGESDIEQTRMFKEAGYKISVNIIATDIFVSRLSCFEREAFDLKRGITPRGISKESQERMYNSFVPTVRKLEELGLVDEVNVFTRGKTVKDDPILIYEKGNSKYKDFKEAIDAERKRQRDLLLKEPEKYFERIKKARETIRELGQNEELTQNALNGLDDLEKDFAEEVLKHKSHEGKMKFVDFIKNIYDKCMNKVKKYFKRNEKTDEKTNESENSNGTAETTPQTKIDKLKARIQLLRNKAFELINQGSDVRNDVYELLFVLSNEHRVEDVDDVCDFMEEIDEKYGLIKRGESDISKLYTELSNERNKESLKKMMERSAKYGDGSFVVEFTNSDEDIFSNPDTDSEDVIRTAEERIELYKGLLHNIQLSNYEHQLLLERLRKIQKIYDDMARQENPPHIQHPTIEDFRE